MQHCFLFYFNAFQYSSAIGRDSIKWNPGKKWVNMLKYLALKIIDISVTLLFETLRRLCVIVRGKVFSPSGPKKTLTLLFFNVGTDIAIDI